MGLPELGPRSIAAPPLVSWIDASRHVMRTPKQPHGEIRVERNELASHVSEPLSFGVICYTTIIGDKKKGGNMCESNNH